MRVRIDHINEDEFASLGPDADRSVQKFGSTAVLTEQTDQERQRRVDLFIHIQDENGKPLKAGIINKKRYDGSQAIRFEHLALFTYEVTQETEIGVDNIDYTFGSGVVDYDYETDSTREERLTDIHFEPYRFVIRHGGQHVVSRTVSQDEFTQINETRYEYTITVPNTYYGESFSGAREARKIGDKLAVTWDPVRAGTSRGYEIFVGYAQAAFDTRGDTRVDTNPEGYERVLVGDPRGDTQGVIIKVPNQEVGHAQLTWRSFMEGKKVLVREMGTSFTGGSVDVETGLPEADGSDVATVSLFPGDVERITDDVFIAWAEVGGAGEPNPVVDFTATGELEIIEAGLQAALIKAHDGGGELTATSVVDETVSGSSQITTTSYEGLLGTPDAPTGLRYSPYGRSDGALVSWDDPGPNHYTRVQIPLNGFVRDTYDTSMYITGIKHIFTVMLEHIGPTGNISDRTTLSVQPDKGSVRPVGITPRAMKGVQLSPGSTHTLDLSQHIHFYESSSDRDPLVRMTHHGHEEVTATQDELDPMRIDIALDAAAEADSDAIDVLMFEIIRSPEEPLWIAYPITRGVATESMEARGINGYPIEWLNLVQPTLEEMVGDNPERVKNQTIDASLSRQVSSIYINDDGQMAGSAPGDGTPGLLVLRGEKGVACFCGVSHPGPAHVVPTMPDGEISRVERFDGIINFNTNLYKPEASPDQWLRVETVNDELWEIGLGALPEEVYFEAPVYYGDTWLNEALYPDDASIDWDAGLVRYRRGFESPAADEADITIDRFEIIEVEEGFDVEWDAVIEGYPVDGLVTIDVTPSDTGRDSFTLSGQGSATVRGLDPDLDYTFSVGSVTETASPLQPRPTLEVKARRTADLNYTYTYDSDAAPDTFTDGFGDEHQSPEFPFEVHSDTILREHGVRFEWDTEESFTVRTAADWTLPTEPVTEEISLGVGIRMKAQDVPEPTFESAQYSGTTTRRLEVNTFSPGRYRIEPVGYLPLHVTGELEDHVSVWFKGPDGEDLGAEIEISQSTELEVWVEVADVERMSPVLLGARIVHWK